MKSFMKVCSLLLAVIIAVVAVGCTPVSLKAEWSYKTDTNELPIGVYIYSLNLAYSQAESYASELDEYDATSDAWLDLEITDDDGEKAVAREWIKNEAEKMCLAYLVVDEQIEKLGIDVSGATMDSANSQAKEYWDMGQYASYGYFMPMSEDLEPYGISYDSFAYCTTQFSVKYQAVFNKVYGEGGSKEVADSEYETYFTENYSDYSYFLVNLYEASTDEAGTQINVAVSDAEEKKLTSELDGYAERVNKGESYDDVIADYMKANDLDTDPATSNVENLENSSLGEDVLEAIKSLDNNKATTLKVGDDDTAVYYFVYKRDIKDDVQSYVYDETQRSSILSSMKAEEFSDYVDELAKELDYEKNESAINKYKPEMFFVKAEETTAATTSSSEE